MCLGFFAKRLSFLAQSLGFEDLCRVHVAMTLGESVGRHS